MNDVLLKFKAFVKDQGQNHHNLSLGLGWRRSKNANTLDVWFPLQFHQSQSEDALLLAYLLKDLSLVGVHVLDVAEISKAINLLNALGREKNLSDHELLALQIFQMAHDQFEKPAPAYAKHDLVIYLNHDLSQSIESAEEAYFKLHLISKRIVKPHQVNTNGAFAKLTNVAWTNLGPILPQDVDHVRVQQVLSKAPLEITHVDKFPYMVNYCVPQGVRIADAARVRLGAHLAEGTTVMPAGYVNFNAGTLGQSMIEGRVSAGVVVGAGTDVGGGASIMGTLSGGGKEVVSLGQNCLLGANSGVGISLGQGCTVAAGVYVTASAKVSLYNASGEPVDLAGLVVQEGQNVVKALELSGRNHLLFLQDSQSGKLVCKPNVKQIALNEALHKN